MSYPYILSIFLFLDVIGGPCHTQAKEDKTSVRKSVEKKISDLNVQYGVIRTEKVKLLNEKSELERKISELKKALDIEQAPLSTFDSVWNYTFNTKAQNKNLRRQSFRRANSLKSQIEKEKRKLSDLQLKLDNWNSEAQAITIASKKISNIELGFEGLSQELKGNQLSLQLGRLSNEYIQMDSDLDNIIHQIDKTTIGAYFQDKIGLLLNSNVICTARKRCVLPKNVEKPIPNHEIISELFPESSPTAVRQQSYYQKMYPKKSKQKKSK